MYFISWRLRCIPNTFACVRCSHKAIQSMLVACTLQSDTPIHPRSWDVWDMPKAETRGFSHSSEMFWKSWRGCTNSSRYQWNSVGISTCRWYNRSNGRRWEAIDYVRDCAVCTEACETRQSFATARPIIRLHNSLGNVCRPLNVWGMCWCLVHW